LLCGSSSHGVRVSHYPKDSALGRVAGLGMNEFELSKNPQLTEYVAKDLNVEAKLPYDDNSFDGASKLLSSLTIRVSTR